jgi:hypothetical protein
MLLDTATRLHRIDPTRRCHLQHETLAPGGADQEIGSVVG